MNPKAIGRPEDGDDDLPDLPVSPPTDPNNRSYIPIPDGFYNKGRKECTDENALSFLNFCERLVH